MKRAVFMTLLFKIFSDFKSVLPCTYLLIISHLIIDIDYLFHPYLFQLLFHQFVPSIINICYINYNYSDTDYITFSLIILHLIDITDICYINNVKFQENFIP